MAINISVEINFGGGIGVKTYGKSNILEISRGSQSQADNILPIYGVLPQYANISFKDASRDFKAYAENDNLRTDLPITIKIDNKIKGVFLSEEWSYADNKKVINVKLKDSLANWHKIRLSSKKLTKGGNGYTIYSELTAFTPTETFVLETGVQTWLTSINIKYVYFEASSLYDRWEKLCQIAQLTVHKLENGHIMIRRVK